MNLPKLTVKETMQIMAHALVAYIMLKEHCTEDQAQDISAHLAYKVQINMGLGGKLPCSSEDIEETIH